MEILDVCGEDCWLEREQDIRRLGHNAVEPLPTFHGDGEGGSARGVNNTRRTRNGLPLLLRRGEPGCAVKYPEVPCLALVLGNGERDRDIAIRMRHRGERPPP